MKKISLTLILLFLTISIFSQPKQRFLRTKSYFNTLFSIDEVSKLNSAEAYKLKANSDIEKSNKYYDKADEYEKKSKLPIAASDRYKRKAYRKNLKGAKYSIKANTVLLEANKDIKSVYISKLKSTNITKDKELIANLRFITQQYLDSSFMAKSRVPNSLELDDAVCLGDAVYFEEKALLFMEYQMAVLANDKKLTEILKKKYDVKKVVQPKYYISQDTFLFQSKTPKIDEIISYSSSEEEMFLHYYELGKKGHELDVKANTYNVALKKMSDSIAKEELDFLEERNLIQEKNKIFNEQLSKKISSIKNYYSANENY
ncbi:MAG: hypothetical protein U9Q83_00980, partial [Bacteroidota bacterium]|nr:hypothetical protein [Bacteroidota bacterium]